METDVAIVGGGIAGSALATVLAREGLAVVVLERQGSFADQVRGENLHPWGIAEARRLDLYDVLRDAGGHLVEQTTVYADAARGAGPARTFTLDEFVHGVPGELNLGHPQACEALAAAASASGVTMLRGVRHVEITPGERPRVAYRLDDAVHEVTGRLVVGADGRSSRVRRQAGIPLERAPASHLITGLLVDNLDLDPGANVVVTGEDVWMVAFPQGGGRARVYLCRDDADPRHHSGEAGIERFLTASCFDVLPDGRRWAEAIPAGPCRTFPADDTWTDRPFTDGIVLIGDAAGYTDPLIGQGMPMALRDVRRLAGLLLEEADWGESTLLRYGAERAERLRRVRFLARLLATAWITFGPQGRRLRRGLRARQRDDPTLLAPDRAVYVGPDHLEPRLCTERFRRRYLGLTP